MVVRVAENRVDSTPTFDVLGSKTVVNCFFSVTESKGRHGKSYGTGTPYVIQDMGPELDPVDQNSGHPASDTGRRMNLSHPTYFSLSRTPSFRRLTVFELRGTFRGDKIFKSRNTLVRFFCITF